MGDTIGIGIVIGMSQYYYKWELNGNYNNAVGDCVLSCYCLISCYGNKKLDKACMISCSCLRSCYVKSSHV